MANILFVVPSLIGGGAERNLVWLANCWARTGSRTVVASVSGADSDVYSLDPGVHREALGLDEESRHLPGAVLANLRRVAALRRVIRQERALARAQGEGLVVISFIVSANILTTLAAVGLGVPVVVSERNHPPRMTLPTHWRLMRGPCYGLAGRVVALTTRSADWLQQHTRARQIDILPNPVVFPIPESEPRVAPDSILPAEIPVILAAGKLLPQKGFDLLIDAYAALRDPAGDRGAAAVGAAAGGRPWHLVILGGGDTAAFEQQAVALGVADRVHLVGRVGNLGDWYARASMFVLSSRYEGFPNVLVEAMASGLPVVSADCETGPGDIITHGRDGWLVPVGSSEALADGMQRLLDDADLRETLQTQALRLRARLDPDSLFRRWQALVNELPAPDMGVKSSCAE